jgi:hypothetical protein
MPIYFSEQAPTCPISTDQSTGPRQAHLFNRPVFVRPTIPRVPSNANLADVILIANIARSIVTQMSNNQVRNNMQPPRPVRPPSVAKDKHLNKTARWKEQKDKRVKHKYKYFGKDADGNDNREVYITMERLDRMVWYDSAWKAYLTWEYGDKGEGERV